MPGVSSSKETNVILIKAVDYSDWQVHNVFSCKKNSVTATEAQKNSFPQITLTNFNLQKKPMPKRTRGIPMTYTKLPVWYAGWEYCHCMDTKEMIQSMWTVTHAQGRPLTPGYPEVQCASPRGLKNHSGISSSKMVTQEGEAQLGVRPGSFLW